MVGSMEPFQELIPSECDRPSSEGLVADVRLPAHVALAAHNVPEGDEDTTAGHAFLERDDS